MKIVEHPDINNSPSSNRKSVHSTYAPSYDFHQYYPPTPTSPQYNSYPSLYPQPTNNTPYYPQYQLSSSAPSVIDTTQKESEQKKHLASGPPALHYMPK